MSSLNLIGNPFIELHTVDSTNNYAMGLIHAGMAQHGIAVFAHEQIKGRGQRNKQWISQSDKNIALSVIIEPVGLSTSQQFLLSKAIAVATVSFVNTYIKEAAIKWPNDIYWCDRKAGGILIENNVQGVNWKYAVAGIGLNINQTDFQEYNNRPVSLKQITGKHFEPVALAKKLCASLEIWFQKMRTDPSQVVQEYHANLYKRNENVRFKKGSRVFNATVKEVTDQGQLVVQHTVEEKFEIGEIEWLINNQ